jgi:hypothetical protein
MSRVEIVKLLDREPVELIEVITPRCANTFGSAPCTATAAAGGECFETRATCRVLAAADFQARPLGHLEPDRFLNNGDTGATDFNGEAEYFIETDLFIPLDPEGCVFEVGSATTGLYIGFTSGNLVVRAGDAASADPANACKLSVSSEALQGKSFTLIARFEYNTGTDCTVTVYLFDPVELELTLVGSDTSSGDPTTLFDDGDYAVGQISLTGNSPVGESEEDYNGSVTEVRVYDNQTATLFPDQDKYRRRYFFSDGRKAAPSDDIYIMPNLLSVSSVGSRINISGTDQRYETLGRRAYMEFSCADSPHSDHPYDPYRVNRNYDPLDQGTFWQKWLAREKFGKTRSIVRRYTGYDGQKLSEMRRQTYVLDRTSRGQDQLSVKSRDVLSLTEFRRAQVPAPTSGQLDVLLTEAEATSMVLAGDVTDAYPDSTATVRINNETIIYTSRTYDGGLDQTTFTGLTRGSDGSEAAEHEVEDNVQLCRRYTDARVKDILQELFVNDARIPAQLIDISKIITEDDENLGAYQLTTLITEPTGVDQLIGELAESCAFYVWWNERNQVIDMQAIKPLSTVERALTDEEHLIGSVAVEERPKERVSTLSLYYNPRNFAGDLNKPSNYKNQLIPITGDNNDLDQYAKLPQIREVFSRWLTSEAEANQTGTRYLIRYKDVPVYVETRLDAKDSDLWLGKFVSLSTDQLQDEFGDNDVRRYVIIEAEEVEAGHSQKVWLADVTLDGRIFSIGDNDAPLTYDEDEFEQGIAFITDNDGLNPDGTEGATIG